MAPNGITRGGATLIVLLLTLLLLGCGGASSSTTTTTATVPGRDGEPSAEESADAALLDKVLGRQQAAVDAYKEVIPTLPPRLARMAAYFRAQEQEHVDALLKVLRGLRSPAEPTPEPLEPGKLGGEREALVFLYEVESASIDEELSAISMLEATWPRSLLASTVANQAQHLTLLRQALGSGALASIPAPFEDGTAEPPD